jgi:hypothetical protein
MSDLATRFAALPPATTPQLAAVRFIEGIIRACVQSDIATEHVIHGGMYARTVHINPGIVLTGALINIPTLLIFSGDADVLVGDKWEQFKGYGVIPASAHRKQAFITRSEVHLTMIFPTQARTVEEAEAEFTDDAPLLMSRRSPTDSLVITGE